MKSKVYNVIYGNVEDMHSCKLTSFSLPKFLNDFIEKDFDSLFIVADPKQSVKKQKEKMKKAPLQTYYKSKYSQLYKQRKSSKITEKQFREILEKLKELKKQSKTREELEEKFEEYKKANNIPPYSC